MFNHLSNIDNIYIWLYTEYCILIRYVWLSIEYNMFDYSSMKNMFGYLLNILFTGCNIDMKWFKMIAHKWMILLD